MPPTLSGSPQGGICSPIFSNLYLHRLDRFVETELLPRYNRGQRRRPNLAYQEIEWAMARATRKGDGQALRALRKQRRTLPSQDPDDPGGLPASAVHTVCRLMPMSA